MPKRRMKKNTRKNNTGRTIRKYRSLYKPITTYNPARRRVILKYTDLVPVNFTTAGTQTISFRGNSLFDPDVGPGTQQPIGFANLAAIYNRYLVTGAKISIEADSNFDGVVVSCTGTRDITGSIADAVIQSGKPCTVSRLLVAGAQARRMSIYCSSSKLFGVKNISTDSDLDYGSLVTTNPAAEWWFRIGHTHAFTAVAGVTYLRIQIKYYAIVYDKVLPDA